MAMTVSIHLLKNLKIHHQTWPIWEFIYSTAMSSIARYGKIILKTIRIMILGKMSFPQ